MSFRNNVIFSSIKYGTGSNQRFLNCFEKADVLFTKLDKFKCFIYNKHIYSNCVKNVLTHKKLNKNTLFLVDRELIIHVGANKSV